MRADGVSITGASIAPQTLLDDPSDRVSRSIGDREIGHKGCVPELWVTFYYDGTNNNEKIDTPKGKHSNVVRLYYAHPSDDKSNHVYPVYIPGLGTYYHDDLTGETDRGGKIGLGFGSGGRMRLRCAMAHLKDRIKAVEAQSVTGQISQIHVAIFGFSRGAALARAFARMIEGETLGHVPKGAQGAGDCASHHPAASGWSLSGSHQGTYWPGKRQFHPISIYFMGLFDTVASVGAPTSAREYTEGPLRIFCLPLSLFALAEDQPDGHLSWAGDLRIPDSRLVKRCVHLVAAHEVRKSFPVDLVLQEGHLPSNCEEILFPGVHSDVGGGYWPGEQGRDRLDDAKMRLSQIPLHHMFREAWKAGVPFRHPDSASTKGLKLPPERQWGATQIADFELAPELVHRYNHYLRYLDVPLGNTKAKSLGLVPGQQASLQSWVEAHMGAYFRWRALVLGQPAPQDFTDRPDKDKKEYAEGHVKLDKAFGEAIYHANQANPQGRGRYGMLLAQAADVHSWRQNGGQHNAYLAPPDEVRQFFQKQVHDSAAEFVWDGTRLSVPRVFYVGGDNRASVAKNENGVQEEHLLQA